MTIFNHHQLPWCGKHHMMHALFSAGIHKLAEDFITAVNGAGLRGKGNGIGNIGGVSGKRKKTADSSDAAQQHMGRFGAIMQKMGDTRRICFSGYQRIKCIEKGKMAAARDNDFYICALPIEGDYLR